MTDTVQAQVNTYGVAYAYWQRWQNLAKDTNKPMETFP
jgi:hypothetical protein